ncbi:hypothetical protein JOD54_002681 [Actinokineospora baliensis]|uniref:hypothetical protein n=1 Tax=Actinokineospora baliensis TaxID=547056 RepID=UPI0019596248|nr:hypothetical protein [Actinokineospora baliensis]MBM7772477.1 hypothetical protein [Actinokineospora baliensis]
MREAALYCRSRGIPAAISTTVGAAIALAPVGRLTGSPGLSVAMSVLATAVAVGVASGGLTGADPDLDRTAAIAWLPRLTVHLVAIAALAAGLPLAIELLSPSGVDAEVLLRNAVGLAGLGSIGVGLLGASRGWVLPVAAASVALVALLSGTPGGLAMVFSWPVQPADVGTAWLISGTFAGCGWLALAKSQR